MMLLLAVLAALGAAVGDRAPRAIVSAMLDARNGHDADRSARLSVPEGRSSSPGVCTPRGVADVVRTYRALSAAFPDIGDTARGASPRADRPG